MLPTLAAQSYSNTFVVLLGLATVFFGLICIIILCSISGAIIKAVESKKKAPAVEAAPASDAPATPCEIPNRGEFVAAVSAALAEELGTDVSSIRIHSITRR